MGALDYRRGLRMGKSSRDLIICLNGDLDKTYDTLDDALKEAKLEQGDVIIIFGAVDNNIVQSGGGV